MTEQCHLPDHAIPANALARITAAPCPNDAAVQDLIIRIGKLPNLRHMTYMASWNHQTQRFDAVLTDFGKRLHHGIETRNRTLLHYLYQEALADQEAALEAIHS